MKINRYGAVAFSVATLCSFALSACSGGNENGSDKGSGEPKKLKVGYAAAIKGDPIHEAIAEVTKALVEKRGWDYEYVNNNVDGPKAVSNAKLLANKKVDAVIEFQVDATVMPTVSKIFKSKDIPWVTYSVPAEGAWIVGVPAKSAGLAAGQALGDIAKEKWNCDVDLLVLLAYPSLPEPNERVLTVPDGFHQVCPDTPDSKIVKFDTTGDGGAAANQDAARNVLVAHPKAKRILFAGMTDEAVQAGLTAAKQLDRYDDAWAWGQGGEAAGLPASDKHLLGSVMYFLEGFPVYALKALDAVAAGEPLPKGKKDSTESKDAIGTGSCNLTSEQIQAMPPLKERVKGLLAAPTGTTVSDLYCPKDE
jgi:ABC-type sugar transport system substrate-binding protein